jgi:hypothetical protein
MGSRPLSITIWKALTKTTKRSRPTTSIRLRSIIPWPVHLTTKHQENFITTHTLLRARQSLPGSVIIALLETVRNRVLKPIKVLSDDEA